jgi:hypothetical protein
MAMMEIFNKRYTRPTVGVFMLLSGVLVHACSRATKPAAGAERIAGTVQSVDGQTLTVSTDSGTVRLQLSASTPVATVAAANRSQITEHSFLGIGSETQPDGSLRAVEITVFPESMRGLGEGNYAWNHPATAGGGRMTNGTAGALKMTNGSVSGSRMTNGTVTSQPGSSSVTLSYKNGSSTGTQAITIPPDVPVVAVAPGQQSDLTSGSHVIVFATRDANGALNAARILVGTNGLVPPQ